MANPKLTKEQKQLRGSYKASRDKPTIKASQALQDPPDPPDTLSTGARQEWLKLVPVAVELQTITRADLRAFELLCETNASVNELQAVVASEGLLIPAANGGKKANPAQRSLETARNQAHRLLCEFGLTPKSRNHVPKAEQPRKSGAFRSLGRPRPYVDDDDDYVDLHPDRDYDKKDLDKSVEKMIKKHGRKTDDEDDGGFKPTR
jgi:P27 family predicted phage terminase small subunit